MLLMIVDLIKQEDFKIIIFMCLLLNENLPFVCILQRT